MKKILCGTTPGKAMDVAIRSAHTWAKAYGAELTFLHVIPPEGPANLWSQLFRDQPSIKWTQKAADAHEKFSCHVLAEMGHETKNLNIDLEIGDFHSILLKKAKAMGCDLIVIADMTEPRRTISLELIVRHAHCPVLLARPETGEGEVLAATDLSNPTLPAVQMASDAALRFHRPLSVMHCLDLVKRLGASYNEPPSLLIIPSILFKKEVEELCYWARVHLQEALQSIGAKGEMIISQEPAFFAITDKAVSLKADLVVVGTHGRSGFSRWLMGSVAETVARQAPCSVLAVHLQSKKKDIPVTV
jgi:nucleotide-binding universal stress UspA family protein